MIFKEDPLYVSPNSQSLGSWSPRNNLCYTDNIAITYIYQIQQWDKMNICFKNQIALIIYF